MQTLLRQNHPNPITDLQGGLPSWQQAGLSVRRLANAPLLLLGLILSNFVAPAWILLTWFVATGSTQQLRPFPITSRHIPSRS
ncbi:MAG: hypothetical protein ACK5QQ_07795 [Cyanobacteriota bacterium]